MFYVLGCTCISYNVLDTHDQKICNALASVVAATLVCSKQTTHLWYHIFSPDELLGTYVTGFLVCVVYICHTSFS